MNEIIQIVKEYIGLVLGWLQRNLETNTEVFVVVAVIVSVILVYTFFKEALDVLTGSNKPALKNKLLDLNQEYESLGKKYNLLRHENQELQFSEDALQEEVFNMKSVQWDKLITPEVMDTIIIHNKEQENTDLSDPEKSSEAVNDFLEMKLSGSEEDVKPTSGHVDNKDY